MTTVLFVRAINNRRLPFAPSNVFEIVYENKAELLLGQKTERPITRALSINAKTFVRKSLQVLNHEDALVAALRVKHYAKTMSKCSMHPYDNGNSGLWPAFHQDVEVTDEQ